MNNHFMSCTFFKTEIKSQLFNSNYKTSFKNHRWVESHA